MGSSRMTLWSYMKSKVPSFACCPSSPSALNTNSTELVFILKLSLSTSIFFSGKKPEPVFKGLNDSPPPCNGAVCKYTSGFHLSDRIQSIDVAMQG